LTRIKYTSEGQNCAYIYLIVYFLHTVVHARNWCYISSK